jgi:FkbM family methyltransferase
VSQFAAAYDAGGLDQIRDRVRALRVLAAEARFLARGRDLYCQFIAPGDLAFDIGAHTGERTTALLRAGARVVAVEPQPDYAARIDKRATVECVAVGSTAGTAKLRLAPGAPELATLSQAWEKTIATRFPQFPYSGEITVPIVTLDHLIRKHGRPVFCKIDAEGYDAEVIAGLSEPITALSFEFAMEALDVALRAMRLLSELGQYRFAYSLGRSMKLSSWLDFVEAEAALRGLVGMAWGDVYARLVL